MKSHHLKSAIVHVYGDKVLKVTKTIWSSIKYGLSNERHDFWGITLQLYTGFWIIYAVLFVIIPLSMLDYDLISLFAYLILLLIFVLPLYVPIYFAWYRFEKQQDKSVIKQDDLNVSYKTKNIIKSMDKIIQNEKIISAITGYKIIFGGNYFYYNVTLVLTPLRIIYYHKKLLGGYESNEYPIKSIISENSHLKLTPFSH